MKFGTSIRFFALATLMLTPTAIFSMHFVAAAGAAAWVVQFGKSYFSKSEQTKSGPSEDDLKNQAQKTPAKTFATQASEIRADLAPAADLSKLQKALEDLQTKIAEHHKEQAQETKRKAEYASLAELAEMQKSLQALQAELTTAKLDSLARVNECATKQDVSDAQTQCLSKAQELLATYQGNVQRVQQKTFDKYSADLKALREEFNNLYVTKDEHKEIKKLIGTHYSELHDDFTKFKKDYTSQIQGVLGVKIALENGLKEQQQQMAAATVLMKELTKIQSALEPIYAKQPSALTSHSVAAVSSSSEATITASSFSSAVAARVSTELSESMTLPAISTITESAFTSGTSAANSPVVAQDIFTAVAAQD